MSELIRAFMDHNSLDSRTAFYSAQLTYQLPAATFAIGRKVATITCKADTWFLYLGATQDSGFFFAGTYQWEKKPFPTAFSVARGSTQEAFANFPQVAQNMNNNMNNFAPEDEAVLFRPGELIQIAQDVRTGSTIALTEVTFVTLLGIEYQMPTGFQVPGYG